MTLLTRAVSMFLKYTKRMVGILVEKNQNNETYQKFLLSLLDLNIAEGYGWILIFLPSTYGEFITDFMIVQIVTKWQYNKQIH